MIACDLTCNMESSRSPPNMLHRTADVMVRVRWSHPILDLGGHPN